MRIAKKALAVILFAILGLISLPLWVVKNIFIVLSEVIQFCTCIGMAKILVMLDKPMLAMSFVKLYQTGKWEGGRSD
jgi:hypothetical protein